MAIALSMELPTCRLKEWSPLADLDFVLAHKVLEDKAYADFFFNRPKDRELILDNSYHELGYPLAPTELRHAALLCRATYVIAPDKVGDVSFNIKSFCRAREFMPGQALAVVMTGSENGDPAEREFFLRSVATAEMLCCTFKQKERLKWFAESPMALTWQRIHLLGVSELDELSEWYTLTCNLIENLPAGPRSWSVDTGKAIKWALKGKLLSALPSLRTSAETTTKGLPSLVSQKILELKEEEITPEVERLLRANVSILQEYCR